MKRKSKTSAVENALEAIKSLKPEIYRGGEKRERILAAAFSLIERHGYKKTTVDEIAREAGVAKGTVYLYFKDKQHIVVSMIAAKVVRAVTMVLESMTGQPDAPSRILRGLRTAIEYHSNDKTVNRILSRDVEFLGPILFKEMLGFEGYAIRFIAELLREGVAEGSIRRDIDPDYAARMILRFNQANIVRIKTGEPVDVDKYIETFGKIVFEGLRMQAED